MTDMSWMFGNDDGGAMEISDLTPIEKWNVGNVIDMSYMFSNCKIDNLNPIDNWDVGSVTSMQSMFWNCTNLTNASEINNWNITKVTNFGLMFSGCPTHPEFTKVTGTWDESGTFTPTTK